MTERRCDPSAILCDVATRHGIRLSSLATEAGFWVTPEVHKRLLAFGGSGALFPDRCLYRAGQGEQRGQRVVALTLEDNSFANVEHRR
jgi:hypothetical protein